LVISKDVSLKNFNTFGIDVAARYYTQITDAVQLNELVQTLEYRAHPTFVLGGGSNLLLTQNVDALVLHITIGGIQIVKEDEAHVWVQAGAGENWHAFVQHCVSNNWGGIENLSLIPGTVGAAPVQNIGAYGSELKDCFEALEAFDFKTNTHVTLDRDACAFGYRDSIFKQLAFKGRYLITHVTFRLTKKPTVNVAYEALQKELGTADSRTLTIQDVSAAVIRIRQSKLPDPAQIGNAGSFFKNPVVSPEVYARIKQQHEAVPAYPQPDGNVKIAAGWLIEQCGWKGKRIGDAGMHSRQALVLVNYGNASGAALYAVAKAVQQDVLSLFGIALQIEVNVV